ncbi:MAG: ParA family protein [Candidatus Nanopelagicales bacterium]
MPAIAVVALKGGVGKTTVTLGLAEAAWRRGLRVLVVDLDPQANATLGLNPPEIRFTTGDVLADARDGVAADAVTASGWGDGLDLIAAEPALEHRNTPGDAGSALRLRRALRGVTDDYDLVLLDSPPSLGEITRNGLAAASHAVVVTEPGYFALRGAEQALEAVTVVRDNTNLRLRALGVVVNRMRKTLGEQKFRFAELKEAYPQLLIEPAIPERSAIQRAEGAGVPLTALGRGGASVAKIFDQVYAELDRRVHATTTMGAVS